MGKGVKIQNCINKGADGVWGCDGQNGGNGGKGKGGAIYCCDGGQVTIGVSGDVGLGDNAYIHACQAIGGKGGRGADGVWGCDGQNGDNGGRGKSGL